MTLDFGLLLLKNFPQWIYVFVGGVQGLGVVVSLLISFFGYKAFKISGDQKHKYFSYGFLFLGLGFLANLVFNLLLRLGYASYILDKQYLPYVAPLYFVYYFLFIGMLLAYASLAITYADIKRKDIVWLIYVWIFIVGVYTFRDDVLFNMFSAILLSFIIIFTYEKYTQSKNKNTRNIFLAFFSLFLFHALVVPEQSLKILFVIRHIVLLVGLGLLLDTMLNIHYGGKKK